MMNQDNQGSYPVHNSMMNQDHQASYPVHNSMMNQGLYHLISIRVRKMVKMHRTFPSCRVVLKISRLRGSWAKVTRDINESDTKPRPVGLPQL